MIHLYCHPDSGHSHRVQLMLELLHLPYRTTVVDIHGGAQEAPEYTAVADEGGLSLEPFSSVRRWLGAVEGLPGFIPMPRQNSKT